ncbi:MAG: NAD-dependent epimerase/dehydratase family protein [Nitrospirae bacterium]|nr:MAG: NAD-dependent epimerase/dehydratase family protein [Nitrospirota bacterium]
MGTRESCTLVTGGAGFIGSHVVEALLARGERVLCLDNFDSFYDPAIKRVNVRAALSNPKYKLIEGDIRDQARVESLCEAEGVTRIFHAAARAGVRPSIKDPLLYEDVNMRGTIVLLEVARRRPLTTFVFASSSSVYGGLAMVPFSETAALSRPISPYAATKLAGELICYTYHHLHKIPITCLRFFTVYGPRQRPEMAIHQFVRQIEDGHPVPMFGDGSSRRDFTYIDDIVQGVVAALDRPFPFEVFNLGESATIELRALIQLIEQYLGKTAKIQALPDQPGDVPVTYADITKARSLLGYRPTTPVVEGVQRFVDWFRTMRRGGA